MRNYISSFFILMLMVIACLNCTGYTGRENTASDDTGKAIISFRQYEHDFGKVGEGEKISCFFSFVNEGTANLVIQSAITTCGCTVSRYERKPIAPGKEGKLEVTFDTSGRNGVQTKTITVHSNASMPAVILRITADVGSNDI